MSTPSYQQRFVLMGLIVFCLLFVLGYATRLAERTRLEAEVEAEEQRIAQSQQEQARLQAELAYVQSDAYVHERARDELGLVLPGDELIIRLAPTAQPAVVAATAFESPVSAVHRPTWQQWLELFWLAPNQTSGR